MDAKEGLIQLLSAVVITVGTWLAARWTGRSSEKAAHTTAEVTAAAVEVDREDRLIKNQEAALARVDREAQQLRRDVDRLRESDQLKERKIRHLEEQGQRLVRSQQQDASLIEGLRQYVRILRDYIEQFGHPVPQAPRNLHLDDA